MSDNENGLTMPALRGLLSDTIRELKAGTITAASANATANLVGKILGSAKLELEYAKAIGRRPFLEIIQTPELEEPTKKEEPEA